MIGGAGNSYIGLRATSSPSVRSTFVSNIFSVVTTYGFDGIDMDWEPFSPSSDGPVLISLLQALQAASVLPRSKYLYTMPVGVNNANFNDLVSSTFGRLAGYLDRLNIMTYEMNWVGDGWQSWHFAPIYGHTASTPSSVDNSVQALLSSGVPLRTIGIGSGFYGRFYENGRYLSGDFQHQDPPTIPAYVTGPYQSTATAVIRYDQSYSQIMKNFYLSSAYKWDSTAMASYLSFSTPKTFGNIRTTFVTYEDINSVTAKCNYIKQKGLGGLIMWEITQAYLASWKQGPPELVDPMMQAIRRGLLV